MSNTSPPHGDGGVASPAPWPPTVLDVTFIPARLRPSSTDDQTPHPYHELVYILRGGCVARAGSHVWELTSGHVLLYPAGVPHHTALPRDGRSSLLVMQWTGTPPSPTHAALLQPGFARDADGRLLALLHWMALLSPPEDPAHRRERDAAGLLAHPEPRLNPDMFFLHDRLVAAQKEVIARRRAERARRPRPARVLTLTRNPTSTGPGLDQYRRRTGPGPPLSAGASSAR